MQLHVVVAAFAAVGFVMRAQAEERRCPAIGDIPALLRCAQLSSDAMVRARRGLEGAQARRSVAGRVLPSNPVLDVGAGRRRAEDGTTEIDRSIALAQTFEIAGQRGARVDAADADVRAAQAASRTALLDLQANVLGAAAAIITARGALAVAREQRAAADRLREVSAARALKGAAPPLETELADAARIQALREERLAAQNLAEAEAELASAVGEDVRLSEGATLPASMEISRSLPALEEAAMARPEVVSAREAVVAERARASLLRREKVPDVTVSAGYSHEEFSDIIGARLSVPLPVFNRNGPEIAEQQSRTAQAESAARQAVLRATFAVRAAFGSWQRARAVAGAISPALDDRLRDDILALQEAYRRGTMPLTLVLASLRETQSARRTLIEVRGDAVRASVELHRAAGLPLCGEGGCR